jgi:hypothetical protein
VRLALASAAGFRSWGPFDRRARLCSVRVPETGLVEIIPTRYGGTRGADKGFHDRAELAFSVGHAPTTAELGAGVRQGLALSLWPPRPLSAIFVSVINRMDNSKSAYRNHRGRYGIHGPMGVE